MIALVCMLEPRRIDWLQQLVHHYRSIGVERFLLTLQLEPGVAPQASDREYERFLAMLASLSIPVGYRWEHEWSAQAERRHERGVVAQNLGDDDWVVPCDADELQVYPAPLSEIVRECEAQRVDYLRGILVDRVAADYSLAAFDADTSLWNAYPNVCNATSALARGDPRKLVLARAPVRVGGGKEALIDPRHLKTISGWVQVHGFKWDATLLERLHLRVLQGRRDPSWGDAWRLLDYFEAHDSRFDPADLTPIALPGRELLDARAIAQYYRGAAETDPDFAPAHVNLGIALDAAGELSAASAAYARAIALDRGHAAAHYHRGLTQLKLAEYAAAEASFRAALLCRTPFAEAWVGLADSLEKLGRDDEALAALESAIGERDDYARALFNAGILARKTGRFDAAIAYQRQALALEPGNPLAHNRLGALLQTLKRFPEAEASYRSALSARPGYVEAQVNLASVLRLQGRDSDALDLLFDAVQRYAQNADARRALAEALGGVPLRSVPEKARDFLVRVCADDNISTQLLSTPIVALLKRTDGFRQLQMALRQDEDPFARPDQVVDAFLRDPLLLACLPRMAIPDVGIEEVLTLARRSILLRLGAQPGPLADDPAVPREFLCALARQCFFSGYAFFADDDELRRVASLRDVLQETLRSARIEARRVEAALATVALYEPLTTLRGSERLADKPGTDWTEAFRPILQEQLADRERELRIAATLPSITSIDDAVSRAVRGQYEENPYPRWTSVQSPKPTSIRELFLGLGRDRQVGSGPPARVLIAGCGTGQHSILAARAYPESEILAVDLSLASLAYAARMTERLGISNVTYRQADILELAGLDQRFAVIECCGVLHHLRDPMAGWRILTGLLEPGGVMQIALYSEKARSGLQHAAQYLRSLGLPLSNEGIRRGRRAIIELPAGHPAKTALMFADFFTLDGCRDLIMHVQEHQYSLPRIEACLRELGLRFLKMDSSSATEQRFHEMLPDRRADDLDAWDRYEQANPSAFGGMYFFWCCRMES